MSGFTITKYMCQHPTCSEMADGIPDGNGRASGLPVGWIQLTLHGFDRSFMSELTSAFQSKGTFHYCSIAHVPSEVLPEEAVG